MIKIKTVPALILGWLAVSGAASAFPAGNTQWELRMNIDETLTRICQSPHSYSKRETRSGSSFRKALISFGTDSSYEIKLGESQAVINAGTYKQEGDALTLTPNEEWLPLSALANYPGGSTIVDKVKSYAPKKLKIQPRREEFSGMIEAPSFAPVKLSLSEFRRYRFVQIQGLQTCTSVIDVNLDAFGTYQ